MAYYEGYKNALKELETYSIDDLLTTIDGLYGRSDISDCSNYQEVYAEAQKQVLQDWTVPSSDPSSLFWLEVFRDGEKYGW